MPYIGKKPENIIATAVDATTGDFSGNVTAGGTLGVTGIGTFTDDIIIGDGKTIGSASDVDAMTIASNGQVTFSQTLIGTALDISGDIDVDGTTNLDNTDIDGTLNVQGEVTLQSDLLLGDSDVIRLGASADLLIYHDGSHSYLQDNGTGNIKIQGANIEMVDNDDGGSLLQAVQGGAVQLFHNNSERIATTSTGVTVTGNIANASGDLTIDSAGQLVLDYGSGAIITKAGGTEIGKIHNSSTDFVIESATSDKDILFKGNDGGSGITALTLDMSEAGRASFNTHVDMAGILVYSFIGSGGIACQQTPSANHSYIALNMRNSSGTQIGHIGVSTTAAAYNTGSDYRLKENISYSFDATSRLKQLKPARFNFIEDADNIVDGFIAHEVSSIVPEAITGEKDATEDLKNVILNKDGSFLTDNISEKNWEKGKLTTDEDGNTVDPIYASDTTWVASKTVPNYQSIDQAKLVPLLVKSLQEALTEIDTLKTKVAALENA